MFRIHQLAARQHCPPTSRRHSTNSHDFSPSLSSYHKQYKLNSNSTRVVSRMSSSMKLLTIFLPLLTAIPLATSAAPLPGSPSLQIQPQQQRPLAPPPTDSFSTSSDTESTSSESSRSSRFSLKNILKPAKTFSSTTFSSTKEFKCHSFPTTSILLDVSSDLTNLLRGYREIIYSSGSGNNKGDGNLFKTCYAGYTADDVDPAIYFGNLAKKQVVVVEKLLRNLMMGKLEGASIVKSGDTIALVMRNGTKGLKRRNTV